MPADPTPRKTLILTRSQVEGLVTMAEVIEAVEAAHADISRGTAAQPSPGAMALPSGSGAFLTMTALADRQGLAAAKFLADIPDNAVRRLPTQRSVLLLVSQEDGFCEGILHGQIPTRIRTAATSAVATRHLAREGARVLGLIGAGELAVAHVAALTLVRPFERLVFWTRNPDTAARFADRIAEAHPGLEVAALSDAPAVFAEADVVCTLTPSREPLVEGAWFRSGQHINAVGAPPRPDHREIDAAGMARARVFVDSRETAFHESGDLLLAIAEGALTAADVGPELGDVITGAAPGRTYDEEITLYDSVGIAMQDIAIGALLLEKARDKGVGIEIDLAS
ncbi:MAG: ornithine cyclodeaminase family protein [Amaricoccus sp.]